jgi:hypothetical protein
MRSHGFPQEVVAMMSDTRPRRGSVKGVDVSGGALLGFIDGMGGFKVTAHKLLNDSGIMEPQSDHWYPLEALLLILNKVADEGGVNVLRQIGASLITKAQWPKEIDSLSKALHSVDVSYHMNHRRSGKVLFDASSGKVIEGMMGHNTVVPPAGNEHRALYVCDTFYPCELDFGIASAFVRKFKPLGCNHHATIVHGENGCRRRGDQSCTYIIEW